MLTRYYSGFHLTSLTTKFQGFKFQEMFLGLINYYVWNEEDMFSITGYTPGNRSIIMPSNGTE